MRPAKVENVTQQVHIGGHGSFPKINGTLVSWGPYSKDDSILGWVTGVTSMFTSETFGNPGALDLYPDPGSQALNPDFQPHNP